MPLTAELGLAPDALGDALLAVAEELHAGLSVKDATTGRYLHANARMATCLGLVGQDLVGCLDAELLDQAAWVPLRAAEQFAATQPTAQTHLHRVALGGQLCEFSVVRLLLHTAQPTAAPVLLSLWLDQTAQRQREQQLQQALRQLEVQAAYPGGLRRETAPDNPADLSARAQFEDQLRRELDLSNREHREFALVSVALDPFSEALQAKGASARQRVQEAVERLLSGNTRAMDASCRLDTTHFAILLSGVGLATAHARIEGLRRQCATEIIAVDGEDLRFTVSMGVASYPHTSQDRDALVHAAELALAQAQRRGGNHVALASIRFEPR
jgi:diguanylate cyclase (GGDEF)-like protein